MKKAKRPVSHVASCTFWHSLVGIDERGRPTTNVLGWADTRSREYTAVLQRSFDEQETHNRTGAHFHSSFWTSKLLWLRREFPEVWARTVQWLSFADYLSLQLFGQANTSVSMASATGIFDQTKCDWDSELLKFLKVKRSSLRVAADDRHSSLAKFARRGRSLKMPTGSGDR